MAFESTRLGGMDLTIVEVCAGSTIDCLIAQKNGAHRIELNSALSEGGLTPSYATVKRALKEVSIPIITMVRPRSGGFCYSELEKEIMFEDAEQFLTMGAKGIAFGFLLENGEIDQKATLDMIQLCHQYQAEAVFHRAFDCVNDPFRSCQQLVDMSCNRILTSGQEKSAWEGRVLLSHLYERYRQQIEFCMGAGIHKENFQQLIQETGIQQIHGSFKKAMKDVTSRKGEVNFSLSGTSDYDEANPEHIQHIIQQLEKGA